MKMKLKKDRHNFAPIFLCCCAIVVFDNQLISRFPKLINLEIPISCFPKLFK